VQTGAGLIETLRVQDVQHLRKCGHAHG
jgi:hypothetical protein